MFSQTSRIAAAGHRAGLLTRLLAHFSLRRQRLALSRLDAALLADVGLTERQAVAEAGRPAWDVPPTWRL